MKSLAAPVLGVGAMTLVALGTAQAAPIDLKGDFLEIGVNDVGTFGSGHSVEPGILHDPTGTQNFAPGGIFNDYLTPGTPHDGFAIKSDQTGILLNDNDSSSPQLGSASPVNTSVGNTLSATWTASVTGLTIANTYEFLKGGEQIHVTTKITNTGSVDLTNLFFGRSEDPDPDVNKFGTFDTKNTRGDSTTAPADLVSGAGQNTGLTIGILNTTKDFPSNTSISFNCCANSDPQKVFDGTDNADYATDFPTTDIGDFGLQMAWNLGTLAAGDSDTISYDYVFGTNQGTVSTGGGGVPEPATWLMLLAGFFGLGAVARAVRKSAFDVA